MEYIIKNNSNSLIIIDQFRIYPNSISTITTENQELINRLKSIPGITITIPIKEVFEVKEIVDVKTETQEEKTEIPAPEEKKEKKRKRKNK